MNRMKPQRELETNVETDEEIHKMHKHLKQIHDQTIPQIMEK